MRSGARDAAMAGSLGYAERLSVRDDVGGRLGDPELLDEGARSRAIASLDGASREQASEAARLAQATLRRAPRLRRWWS